MTRRERLERRAERREEWADSAHRKASGRFETARHALDGIEPGQPILVGHHSEKAHRRAIERHDANLSAGFERERMAERHEQAASTLRARLDASIYSDDTDAVLALEERIRAREAEAARIKALNAAIRREQRGGFLAGWLERIGATEDERRAILRNVEFDWRHEPTFAPYVLSNLRGRIDADRKRLASIKAQEARAHRERRQAHPWQPPQRQGRGPPPGPRPGEAPRGETVANRGCPVQRYCRPLLVGPCAGPSQ
jgi:hypothetical protein